LAREGLWILQNRHELAWASAAVALEVLLRERQGEPFTTPRAIAQYHPTPAGTSLNALRDLARVVGLQWQMGFREARTSDFPVPAVVHLRSGHYAALVRAEAGRYLMRDPILGGDLWVTRDALMDESSGYALFAAESGLPEGWRAATNTEADKVVGHCVPGVPGRRTLR
jgi:ABC-type bacteriocin/lantibiotic exporter with double-glycine peptidase domain